MAEDNQRECSAYHLPNNSLVSDRLMLYLASSFFLLCVAMQAIQFTMICIMTCMYIGNRVLNFIFNTYFEVHQQYDA